MSKKLKYTSDDIIWYDKGGGERSSCDIDSNQLAEWLKSKGFGLHTSSRDNINLNDEELIVRYWDGKITRFEPHALSKFVIRFFRDIKPKLFEKNQVLGLNKKDGTTFSKSEVMSRLAKNNLISNGLLHLLEDYDDEFPAQFNDGKHTCYVPFKNKIVRITKDKIDTMVWDDVDDYVWERSIQNRNIELIDSDEEGIFENFFKRCCNVRQTQGLKSEWMDNYKFDNDKYHSLRTHYGYLISNYKDKSKNPCVYFTDQEADNTSSEGGTGKSLVMESVKQFKNQTFYNGKDTSTFKDSKFLFSDVTSENRMIFIDDPEVNFPFDKMYTYLTGDMVLNIKFKNGRRIIKFDKSPKFGITSNYISNDMSTSSQRRKSIVEFGSFWNQAYHENESPSDEKHYGMMLFDDFDNKQWNLFYNFGFKCVQFFLQNGLMKEDISNYEWKQLCLSIEGTRNTGESDWIKDWLQTEGIQNHDTKKTAITLNDLYDKFCVENPISLNLSNKFDYRKSFQSNTLKVSDHIKFPINIHKLKKLGKDKWSDRRCQRNINGNKLDTIYVTDMNNQLSRNKSNNEGLQEGNDSVHKTLESVGKHENNTENNQFDKSFDELWNS